MSPHPGVVLDSAKQIDTTIPAGTRVVLVEDHRDTPAYGRIGQRGVLVRDFDPLDEEIDCAGGYQIQFDGADTRFMVNASAVRRESEVDAPKVEAAEVPTPFPSEAIPNETVQGVLVDDFRDRLILECAVVAFKQLATSGVAAHLDPPKFVEFVDQVVAERAKGDRLASLRDSLRDVFEVVPSGQPVTRMAMDAALHAAPGVVVEKEKA